MHSTSRQSTVLAWINSRDDVKWGSTTQHHWSVGHVSYYIS